MHIKICGIASKRDADAALAEGADSLGFAFMRGPRRADPRFVREIIRSLPDTFLSVGVFRNQPLDDVRSILTESGVRAAQLNGSEPPEFAAALGVPVIKAFSTFTRRSLEEVSRYDSFAYLADPGGRGAVDADWAACAKKFGRVLVSAPPDVGALHDMIHRVRPWGVDAAGCTDSAPGVKDPARIRAVVAAVRAAAHDTQKIRVTIR
ncbi:MAG TPA: phosphoribosylanthranilate isomerase [Planctomycetota bacterium]|nr:phosphoribosylanthranilate isomerase [Planctomycetota bacterium]